MIARARGDLAVRCVTPMPDPLRDRWTGERAPISVREWGRRYDDEGSEVRSLGSVSVGAGTWWSVALTVPGAADAARETILLRVERHGAVDERHGDVAIDLVLPSSEIDAVVTLLGGVIAQARRDGVLPPAGS